jgi:hypothetical protein
MSTLRIFFLFFTLYLFSCNSEEKQNNESISEQEEINKDENLTYLNKSKAYEGKINNKYDIVIDLFFNEDKTITGSYFYKNIGKDIEIKGNVVNGKIILHEYDHKGKSTGVFIGKINQIGDYIDGNWSRPNGDKSTSFYFNEISQEDKEKHQLINAINALTSNNKSNQFYFIVLQKVDVAFMERYNLVSDINEVNNYNNETKYRLLDDFTKQCSKTTTSKLIKRDIFIFDSYEKASIEREKYIIGGKANSLQ